MGYIPPNTRLYNQALEILNLSRSISHYLSYDLSSLQGNGKENPFIYFTGDMIRQSDSLVPEIIKAENESSKNERLRYAASLNTLTNSLYKTCDRLEHAHTNGSDFIKLLRKELRKFKQQQRKWLLTL